MADDNENRALLEDEDVDNDPMMAAPIAEPESEDENVAQAERISVPTVTYDITLPAAHSYLGNDLEDLAGRTVHEEAANVELPALTVPTVVLFPGQVLPLHVSDPRRVRMLRYAMNKDRTFGILPSLGTNVGRVGTTAEISSYKEESVNGVDTIVVKAQGRQRFAVVELRFTAEGMTMVRAKILSEAQLPDPLRSVHGRMCRMFHYRPRTRLVSLDYQDDKFCLVTRPTAPLYDACSCSRGVTQWPPWVYKQYDQSSLTKAIMEEIRKSWDETLLDSSHFAHSDFSYWLAANLPWANVTKVLLLAMDSPIQRLRLQLRLMRQCTVLMCDFCGEEIANKRDILSLSCTGPMAAYVNPQGHVHETITLHGVLPHSLDELGGPQTENSWFPGYAWTVLECHSCSSHMGWKFTAVKSGLEPKVFWGLRRASITPSLGLSSLDTEENDEFVMNRDGVDEMLLQQQLVEPYRLRVGYNS